MSLAAAGREEGTRSFLRGRVDRDDFGCKSGHEDAVKVQVLVYLKSTTPVR